jgi:SAM-dependent methyltransferase
MTDRLIPVDTAEAAAERNAVAAGRLPPRYALPWQAPFLDRVAALLHPGIRILDVGSGARPTLAVEQRPSECHYVGLDVSADELERAGPVAYSEVIVGDICQPLPPDAGRFDLVLSWQVLEHVPSMRAALATQASALVPGGRMLAMVSGAYGFHSVAARIIPYRFSTALQQRLLDQQPENKFPTRYDACTDRALRRLFDEGGWSSWSITPYYKAGGYLRFSRKLQFLYLVYENWVARRRYANLATHYLIEAVV